MNGDTEEDPDLGPPIVQLVQLSQEPRRGFVERVRSSIERRRLGSHVSGLAWLGLSLVLLEFLAVLMTPFVGARERSDRERDPPPTA